MQGRRFRSYSEYFRSLFGTRVQKVTIDAGFTCPNRDGTVATGGCTFCLNDAFSPSYCRPEKSITEQINEGIGFHARRYAKSQKFLAYFQSFSNTYKPLCELQQIYSEALQHPEVVGLVIGTRPDCVDQEKLDYFNELSANHYVVIEYGIESVYDDILRDINRGHDFATARRAVEMTAERGIHCGAHFIIGFPGESPRMVLDSADVINSLPLDTVKFHQLQLFKGTEMAREYAQNPDKYHFYSLPNYIDLFIDLLERLRPDLIIERFAGEAPPEFHINHSWGKVRNETLIQLLEKRLEERDTYQGKFFDEKQK